MAHKIGITMKVIALVGRPNVGKSTLFNRLTRTRDALVADFPGLTRDRKYGRAQFAGHEYIVIDTGGIAPGDAQRADLAGRMTDQALQAIAESDLVLCMVDARAGLLPGDLQVAEHIRLSGRPCAVVANKCDGLDPDLAGNEFYELGLGEVYQVAAAHGRGVGILVEEVIAPLLTAPQAADAAADGQELPETSAPEEPAAGGHFADLPAGAGRAGGAEWERGFAFLDDVPHEQRGGGFDWYAFRQSQREQQSLSESPDHGEQPLAHFADRPVKFAIVGKPNVGKSTLTNRLLGEERVVVADLPGTTRDAIHIPVHHKGRNYIVVDTAGVRRRGRVSEAAEKFSIVKTLRAIEDCNVAVLLIDAHEPLSDQDLSLLGFIIDAGRALVIAVNKWDGLSDLERQRWRQELERRLGFADFARVHFISALHGSGVGHLYASIDEAYASATLRQSSALLNRLLQQALAEHRPPLSGGRRIRLKYAHAGGYNPPRIIIHGTRVSHLPESYRRYLGNFYRRALQIMGTPLSMEFREGENPYARTRPSRRLTQSQQRAREREMREQRHYRRSAQRAAARQRRGQH